MFQKTDDLMTAHVKTANTAIHNKAKVEWQNSKKGKQPQHLFVFFLIFCPTKENSIKERGPQTDQSLR